MRKRTIIILTIVSSFLSLAMILLSYFGIVRYITLHTSSSENFSRNYSKLSKADEKRRIVVSFSLDPSEMDKAKPMINSLLDQTVKVDVIFVTVKQGTNDSVPDYIKDVAVILPAGKDYGDCNNMVPILLREKESDTVIIVLQHDIVYGKDFIEKIVDESETRPSAAIQDSKGRALLVKPEHCGGATDCCSKEYTKKSFMKKIKNLYTMDYNENYKRL